MDTANILEFENVSKQTNKGPLLDGVTFDVRRESIHGLLGEAGSGKVAIARVLAGLYAAGTYEGQVRFDGQPLALRNPSDAIRLGVSIIPRRTAIFDSLSVAENIMMATWQLEGHFVIKRREMEQQAQDVLAHWGMDIDATLRAGQLEPFKKRMVMFARGLCTNPQVVVLDEPLYDITNPYHTSQIMWMIRRMVERGVTCLYLARRPADTFSVADRITVIRDGRVAREWERPDFDEGDIAAAMMGRRSADWAEAEGELVSEAVGLFGSIRGMFDRWMKPAN